MASRIQAALTTWAALLAFLPLAGAWAVEPNWPGLMNQLPRRWGPPGPSAWGAFAPRPPAQPAGPPQVPYQFAPGGIGAPPQAPPVQGDVQLRPPAEPEEPPVEPKPPRPQGLVVDSPLSGTSKQMLRTELAETKQQVHDDAALMKETLVQLKEGHATNQKLTELKARLQKESMGMKKSRDEGLHAANELAAEKQRVDGKEADLGELTKVQDERHRAAEKFNYDLDSLDKLIEDGTAAKATLEKQQQLLSDEIRQMEAALVQKQADMKRSAEEAEAKRQASLPTFAETYGKNGKIEKETEKEQLEAKNAIGAQRLLQRKSTELIDQIGLLRQTNAYLRQHIDKLRAPTKTSKAALKRLRRYVQDVPADVAARAPLAAADQEGVAPDEAA